MRFEFIAKHRGIWPVTWMCEVLDVSPSGFYSWRSRPLSNRALYDEDLIRDIRRSFADSDRTYGVRRIWLDLLDWDHAIGRERVARLVRSLKLLAQPKRSKRPVDKGTATGEFDRAKHTGSGIYCNGSEPEMGSRFYLRLDFGRLVVRCCRA